MFVLYFPPGTICVDGVETDNRTLAKQIITDLSLGKDVLIPQLVDEHGNKLWVLDAFARDSTKHVTYEATANAGVLSGSP